MMQRTIGRAAFAGLLFTALLIPTGCHVDTRSDGDHDNVSIATPFGGLSVKTNEAVVQEGVGLSVYPGAEAVRNVSHSAEGKDHDQGAADINMNFGGFHLGVKALSYKTSDSVDKVIGFYRKDMARFGQVILCKRDHAVGTPSSTQDGLTCERDGQVNVNIYTDYGGSDGELKAGSPQHQHIVEVQRVDGGTKIGLVALDLPGRAPLHAAANDRDRNPDRETKQ